MYTKYLVLYFEADSCDILVSYVGHPTYSIGSNSIYSVVSFESLSFVRSYYFQKTAMFPFILER